MNVSAVRAAVVWRYTAALFNRIRQEGKQVRQGGETDGSGNAAHHENLF